jgi:uncharacterized protein with PIN domain
MSRCFKCNSPVTDSIEMQIEQHGKIKLGSYSNEGWVCDDCSRSHVRQEDSNLATNDSEKEQHEKIEPVKASDVSPNTPKADEAEI